MKENFPTHLQIAETSAEYIARPIVSGGLSNQKAKAIRNFSDSIVAKFGERWVCYLALTGTSWAIARMFRSKMRPSYFPPQYLFPAHT